MVENRQSKRKQRIGKIVSAKMDKTRVVEVVTKGLHKFYKKVIKKSKKYYVHDENNQSKMGDVVLISETRPLSKLKRWRLVKVLKKAELKAKETAKSEEALK